MNGRYEAAILLECDSVQRTRLNGLDRQFLINIDHHATGKPFAHVNWIEPSACATAEMVFWLANQANVKITPEIATCLYTAILTDTGSFCFVGTNEKTFELAKQLVEYGAEPARIAQSVYFSHAASKMRLLGTALSNLHREGPLTWMYVTREQMDRVDAVDEDCEGLVNYALAVEGVEVAVFFREMQDGRWRVKPAQQRFDRRLRSRGAVWRWRPQLCQWVVAGWAAVGCRRKSAGAVPDYGRDECRCAETQPVAALTLSSCSSANSTGTVPVLRERLRSHTLPHTSGHPQESARRAIRTGSTGFSGRRW